MRRRHFVALWRSVYLIQMHPRNVRESVPRLPRLIPPRSLFFGSLGVRRLRVPLRLTIFLGAERQMFYPRFGIPEQRFGEIAGVLLCACGDGIGAGE